MHVHRLTALGCALALAALTAGTALASDQPAPGNDVAKQADKHFLLGKDQLRAGNVREAYKEYKAAWDLKRSYDIAANLGNVEFDLGMPRDAAEHLTFALKNAAVSLGADKLDRIRARLDEARNLVGSAKVQVNIEGAEIFLDGVSVGRSPLTEEIFVDPGPCTIEAKLAGHDPIKEKIDFKRAVARTVTLTLKLTGSVPPLPTTSSTVPHPPPPPPGKSFVPVAIGLGLGAAGLGLGIAGFALSGAKGGEIATLKDKLTDADLRKNYSVCTGATPPTECASLDDAYVAQGSLKNLGIAGFAVAGAAAAGILVYVLTPSAKPEARVRASFVAVPGAGALSIQGHF